MSEAAGKIFITKVAAAQRQLDAAVRMFFSHEDDLAIHTVVAAAYRLLRDLKGKRGKSELADGLSRGLFAFAKDLIASKELPEFLEHDGLLSIIEDVAEGMKRGEIKTYDDINLKPDWDADKRHWEKFNLPANFLKHSDRDATKLLDESELQNRELLVAACAAYKEVMGVWTPEMLVFGQFWLAESCDPPGFVPNEICAKLREVDPSLLYETCLGMIQDMKGEGRGEN